MARGLLCVVNGISGAFGVALVVEGSEGLRNAGVKEAVTGIEKQFTSVVVVGVGMIKVSLFGLFGAFCAMNRDAGFHGRCCSNRLLTAYYVFILLLCSALFYLMMLCFLFVDKATEYVDGYGEAITRIMGDNGLSVEQLEASLKKNSHGAGWICLAAIVVNLVCAHCSARVMGYSYTTRCTVQTTNILTFILGLALCVVAFIPETKHVGLGNDHLPEFVGALGVIVVLVSIVGFSGACFLNMTMLCFNTIIQTILAALLLSFAVVCLVEAKKDLKDRAGTVAFIQNSGMNLCPECEELEGEELELCCAEKVALLAWNNLSVLGVGASVTLVFTVVNALASRYLYLYQRRIRMTALYEDEMHSLNRA